jgi:hypothetical protein
VLASAWRSVLIHFLAEIESFSGRCLVVVCMKGEENCNRRVTCVSYMWLLAFGMSVNSVVIISLCYSGIR